MSKFERKKKFITSPGYPGGNKAMTEFILNEVRIPQEAIENNVSGIVRVKIEINKNGEVTKAQVISGLSHGCDEEAIRVVKKMKYTATSNKGMRAVFNKTILIPFNMKNQPGIQEVEPLPDHSVSGMNITYSYVEKKPVKAKNVNPEDSPNEKKTYNIKLNINYGRNNS